MKIILMGNAGAGKSTMARRLVSRQTGRVAHLALDEIAWDSGTTRKPLAETTQLLKEFIEAHNEWVIEGCYADLRTEALPFCDELRFLNPGVATCISNCPNRSWEPEIFSSIQEQSQMIEHLIRWVSSYETRTDEFGLSRHRAIYENFAKKKIEYKSIAEYEHHAAFHLS